MKGQVVSILGFAGRTVSAEREQPQAAWAGADKAVFQYYVTDTEI